MKRIEKNCVDCGILENCSWCPLNKPAVHYYCDRCQFEIAPDEIYIDNGKELCEYCLKELHLKGGVKNE